MRAIAIDRFGGADTLSARDLPRPAPAAGEILVRVVAAGVNPVDWKIREGLLQGMLPHAFPLIPGWDVAGVVEELGPGVTRFRKGEKVWAYARKPTVQHGCYAELVALPEAQAATMPTKLLFEEAAAVPLAALTAMQALSMVSGLGGQHRVLIHGGAGGVGHFALQLARNAGARAIATAGPANQAFLAQLGASTAIDYTAQDFAAVVAAQAPDGVDLVLDTVGGDTLERSYPLVKAGGSLVSIVEEPDPSKLRAPGARARFHFVEPDAAQLDALRAAADANRLRPSVQRIFPLAGAADAQELSRAGHVRGKLVLNL